VKGWKYVVAVFTLIGILLVVVPNVHAEGGMIVSTQTIKQKCTCWGVTFTFECTILVIQDADGGMHIVHNCKCPC